MTLTQEEQDILDGKKGDVLAKVMKTVVVHGNAFGADKLVAALHVAVHRGSDRMCPR
jgi:predicted aconitase